MLKVHYQKKTSKWSMIIEYQEKWNFILNKFQNDILFTPFYINEKNSLTLLYLIPHGIQ